MRVPSFLARIDTRCIDRHLDLATLWMRWIEFDPSRERLELPTHGRHHEVPNRERDLAVSRIDLPTGQTCKFRRDRRHPQPSFLNSDTTQSVATTTSIVLAWRAVKSETVTSLGCTAQSLVSWPMLLSQDGTTRPQRAAQYNENSEVG